MYLPDISTEIVTQSRPSKTHPVKQRPIHSHRLTRVADNSLHLNASHNHALPKMERASFRIMLCINELATTATMRHTSQCNTPYSLGNTFSIWMPREPLTRMVQPAGDWADRFAASSSEV